MIRGPIETLPFKNPFEPPWSPKDVKPYLPNFEALTETSVPLWVQRSYDEPMMEVGGPKTEIFFYKKNVLREREDK